jgi:hypothetical protein
MSESQSPPPEEHELEIHDDTHVDDDDDGISTDTSGSLPGSPGADEDADAVTICRWDGCHKDLRTLDALVRHVHDCRPSLKAPFLISSRSYWHTETSIYLRMGRLPSPRNHANFSVRISCSLTLAYRGKTLLLQCSRYDSSPKL